MFVLKSLKKYLCTSNKIYYLYAGEDVEHRRTIRGSTEDMTNKCKGRVGRKFAGRSGRIFLGRGVRECELYIVGVRRPGACLVLLFINS